MKNFRENLMHMVFFLCALTSIFAVVLICIFLFANGVPAMKEIGLLDFLTGAKWKPGNDIYGILPMILGSLYITAGAIVIGVPIGLLTAVFMAFYCPKKLYGLLKPCTELLAGIPSIVYGFFGMVIIVPAVRAVAGVVGADISGSSILAASILLGIMILPTIIGVSEAALRAVPMSYYEGAVAMGARHERAIFTVMVPAAKSGVLAGIVSTLEKEGARPGTGTWVEQISAWRTRYPFYHPGVGDDPDEIVPEVVLKKLSESLDPQNSVVVTEVGQHQMWAAQSVDREAPRSFLSSGGLGTMGFGFPAAIGAAIGCPEKQVVCVAGDGSFQMNSQEMATASIHRVPVKVLILDNRCLGMVHQWQKLFYDERYSSTLLDASPDFVKLAEAYGWQGERVEKPADVDAALARMLASDGPYLLDVAISRDQNVYPMVAPGRALDEVIGAIDVAVGAVRTDVPEGDEADGSDEEGSDR